MTPANSWVTITARPPMTPGVLKRWRAHLLALLTSARERIYERLFGFDYFISYARNDRSSYASQLCSGLGQSGYSVFLDKDEMPAGEPLDASIKAALRHSTVLLVVATPESTRLDSWVPREIGYYTALHKAPRVIPIDICHTLRNAASGVQIRVALTQAGDPVWISQPGPRIPDAPTETVLEAIQGSYRFRSRNQRRRRFLQVIFCVLSLMGLAGTAWLGNFFYQRTDRAQLASIAAEVEQISARMPEQSLVTSYIIDILSNSGRFQDAERIALTIRDPKVSSPTWTHLASSVAVANPREQKRVDELFQKAAETAHQIADPKDRATALMTLGGSMNSSHARQELASVYFQEAEQVAAKIRYVPDKVTTLQALAESWLASGSTSGAENGARILEMAAATAIREFPAVDGVAALGQLIQVASRFHQQERANRLLTMTRSMAGDLERASDRALAFMAIAAALEQIGRTQESATLMDLAIEAARAIEAPQRSLTSGRLASVAIRIGRFDDVERILQMMPEADERDTYRLALITALAERSAFNRAEKAATLVSNPLHQCWALQDTARRMTKAGKTGEAARVLAKVQDLADSITVLSNRASVQTSLVDDLIQAGRLSEAQNLLVRATDPKVRVLAAASIGRVLDAQGRASDAADAFREAQISLARIEPESLRPNYLRLAGLIFAESSRKDWAKALFEQSEKLALTADASVRLDLLGDLASALAHSGFYSDSRRVATQITWAGLRSNKLADLADNLSAAGRLREAHEAARQAEPVDRLSCYARILNDYFHARKLLPPRPEVRASDSMG